MTRPMKRLGSLTAFGYTVKVIVQGGVAGAVAGSAGEVTARTGSTVKGRVGQFEGGGRIGYGCMPMLCRWWCLMGSGSLERLARTPSNNFDSTFSIKFASRKLKTPFPDSFVRAGTLR